MGFDIESFKANIGATGLLQSNKYDVTFSFPQGSLMNGTSITAPNGSDGSSTGDIIDDMTNRCISATLPGIALRTIDSNRFGIGVQEKMPFSGNYTDIDLVFLADRYGSLHSFFYSWMNLIFSVTGEEASQTVSSLASNRNFYTTEYKDNYAATVTITVYDNGGDSVASYYLYKAFPIALNDIPVSWANQNDLMKISAKISFREWSLNDFGSKLTSTASQSYSSQAPTNTSAPSAPLPQTPQNTSTPQPTPVYNPVNNPYPYTFGS